MTTQVIFPTEIANGTPATDDRILFSDTSASNATKDCAISELPNSDATVASLALKVDKTTTVNGHALSGNVTVTASDVGLGNVDNTSDASKPVSTAQQTAIDAKVSDTVYGVDWDGVTTIAPSKNAVYDKIETIVSGLTSGTVTSVSSANADIGVATGTTTPVLTLNSGTGANQIVKLNGSAQLPAVDGSLLTNLPSSGHTIQDAGTPLTQRTNLNFASDVFIVTDDAGNNATKVEISSIPLPSYTLSNVTTNRTLDADAITGNELADVVGTLINDIDILSTGGVTSVNGEGGAVTLTSDDISDTAQTHKFVTAADITKLSNLSGTNTGDQTNITGNAGTVTNGVYTTDAGTVFLAPNGSAAALTSFPTLNQDTTGTSAKTNALNSATTVVNVSSATAPSSGQVLTATSSTEATWQTPAGALSWGATANGATGTGVALSMDNSYAASGIGQSITIGNTQTQALKGLEVNTGTSNTGCIGINVKVQGTGEFNNGVIIDNVGTAKGSLLKIGSISAAGPASLSSNIFSSNYSTLGTLTANTVSVNILQAQRNHNGATSVTDNFAVVDIQRINSVDNAGGTLVAGGSVLKITGTDTQTTGTLTPTYNLVSLNPSDVCTGSSIKVTVANSTVAPTNGHLYMVIGDTQAVSHTLIKLDTGVDTSPGQNGISVIAKNTGTGNGVVGGIAVNCYGSNTQAVSDTQSLAIGNAFNSNSSFSHQGIRVNNVQNAGAGANTGIYILSASTDLTIGANPGGSGLHIFATGTAQTIYTNDNVNLSTNGLVNYTLSDSQSGATVMQKINLGTSAQANIGTYILAAGASTSQIGLQVDKSSTGTGQGIQVLSSLSGAGTQEDIIGIERTNAGAVGARALQYFKNSSGVSKGKVINAALAYYNLESATANSGYIDLDSLRGCSTTGGGYVISANKSGTGSAQGPIGALYCNSILTGSESNVTLPLIYVDASTSTNKMPLVRGLVMDMVVASSVVTNPLVTDFSQITRQRTNTHTSTTLAENFNLNYFKRTSIQNGAGGTFTSAGSVLKLENVATQTAGTLTDTTIILDLNQGVTTSGTMIKMTCGNTNSAAFDFATNLTTATAPAGASTYINIKVNGVAYRMLAQAVA